MFFTSELALVCCPVILALTISPEVLPSPVLEGTELVITCTTSGVGAGAVVLLINGQISEVAGVIQSVTSVRVFNVPVDRSHHGAKFTCTSTFDNTMSQDVILSEVQCKRNAQIIHFIYILVVYSTPSLMATSVYIAGYIMT